MKLCALGNRLFDSDLRFRIVDQFEVIICSFDCLLDAPLPYTLVPKVEREAAQAEGREVRDDGNKADSDVMRDQIGEHNARWRAVCGVTK